jgi:hypothetical protein
MSTELIPAPDHAPAIAASESQLRALQDGIKLTLEQGEVAMAHLREIAGAEPSGLAGELHKRFNFGLAMFRECEATLASCWRARNAARRAG